MRCAMSKRLALVTGASSGLGAEFARALARRDIDLVLVARREEPMQQLADELRQLHDIDIHLHSLDLGVTGSAAALRQWLADRGLTPDILINNAAFGLAGRFVDQDPVRIRQMLELDIISLVELTHVFARDMVSRNGGHILLVGSLAAYQPDPLLAAYGAAKSFVLSFGEALHVELAPTVGITVVSPGLMQTEFFNVANFHPGAALRRGMLPAATVAEEGIKALFAGKPSIVVGGLNRLSAIAVKFLPRSIVAKVAYRLSNHSQR
ncbi:short-chain dehydrogenase [Robbsia andropogonis]|uniref:Short-chain dehydrogenase n=2 Tax=Robbsia andropogonis TaxID=28092 RepID=A0A0F5JYL0_9BURK|nr:short-chain dehydrogenase [Robbsia andropogonis]